MSTDNVQQDLRTSADQRPVTVAINAQINPANAGGVESALQGLITYLADLSLEERYLLLSTIRYAPDLERLARRKLQVVPWPFPQKAYAPYRSMTRRWTRWHARAGMLGPGVDALHWGWWHARRAVTRNPNARQADGFLQARSVSVVHFAYGIRFGTSLPFLYEPWDLQHRHHPEFFGPGEWQWRDQMYREGCEQAALVVSATTWTKRDIMQQYGIPGDKIAVIPRGPWISPEMPGPRDVERARKQYGLPAHFAFYPAMTFPHKNHLRLFEALAILRDRHGVTLPLVCTGRQYEPHWPEVQAGVARFGLQGQVFLLESVPADTLAALFKAASFLVFPSLFEGLGLPVIEALEYGLPVVASQSTCLPEVAGNAALYFDGNNTESIVETLLRAEREPRLLQETREAAPAALARFSWPRAAATFVACYRAVAGAPLSEEQRSLYHQAIAS
ncbi:MAG: glycosyltransferase family 4 protein [Chloroflexota bacterium]